jgi:hypothetical protein
MPLTIYRRHGRACAFYGKSRKARNNSQCKVRCPIWVQGTLRGEKVWRSLGLNDWSAAADLVRSWEASGEIGVAKPETPTPALAVDRFFEDAAKRLKPETISKYNLLLRKQLLPYCEKKGISRLKALDVNELSRFRATWADGPLSTRKKQERMAAFFHFCRVRKWIADNPVLSIKLPEVTPSPTLPFEPEQFERILAACDEYPIKGIYREGNRARLRAIVDSSCQTDSDPGYKPTGRRRAS